MSKVLITASVDAVCANAGIANPKAKVKDVALADMAVFLASKGAKMVSGQVIAVDGHTES